MAGQRVCDLYAYGLVQHIPHKSSTAQIYYATTFAGFYFPFADPARIFRGHMLKPFYINANTRTFRSMLIAAGELTSQHCLSLTCPLRFPALIEPRALSASCTAPGFAGWTAVSSQAMPATDWVLLQQNAELPICRDLCSEAVPHTHGKPISTCV